MILHIANLEKFIPPFVDLVDQEFADQNHQFFLFGGLSKHPIERSSNVHVAERGRIKRLWHNIKLIPLLLKADKVILHGLFDSRLIKLLAFMPWVLKKCYWVIWGGDLYHYQKPKVTLKDKFDELFRGFVFRRLGHLVTYIPGDYELVRKWYNARGEYRECLMYLSNVVGPNLPGPTQPNLNQRKKEESVSGINILVGNSAAPSNNHFEVLDKLSAHSKADIKVYVPLSYGDQEHASKVITHGKKLFGEKFYPITEFMPFDDYYHFLSKIDIAVFNHERQQAMGNTISLLSMGTTVCMRSDVSQFHLLASLGVTVKSVDLTTLDRISFSEREKNHEIMASYFSRKNLIDQWSDIFKD